jgi:REP element-mobilizing transposase RayT
MKIINGDTELRRRNLPHLERRGASYFVTWRLFGTLPSEILQVFKVRDFKKYDAYLDSDRSGDRWLKQAECASIVKDVILDQHDRAFIDCFTIMPNHVHLLFEPHDETTLRAIMKRIKQISSFKCLKITGSSPPFWEEENYDHILRENERARVISYIIRNPVEAGLCKKWKDWPYTYLSEEFAGIDEKGYLLNIV